MPQPFHQMCSKFPHNIYPSSVKFCCLKYALRCDSKIYGNDMFSWYLKIYLFEQHIDAEMFHLKPTILRVKNVNTID